MFPGDANDERVNGPLPIPRDGTVPCQGKGTGNEGEAGGVESLKNGPGKEIALSKQVRGELEKQTEVLKQVLEDKEKEIKTVKDQLRRAKEDAIWEYHDSNALLAKLGGSFANSFNDCFRQFKASFPDLNLSHVSIDA